MNQKEVGSFIAQLRKEKSLTQAELGEKLGVTNKTVSRWENGNYMPDLSVLPTLCDELGVGVNELLSGQRLGDDEFRAHADSNLMYSMQEHTILSKQKRWGERFLACGIGVLLSTTYSPDSWRRITMIWVSLALIAVGWFLRWKVDRAYGLN